jgi:excisionase family DNA binding protein
MSDSQHPDLDEFFTVKEVARRLRVSTKTVRRWIDQEKLKCVRLGRLVRIRPDQLRQFVTESDV